MHKFKIDILSGSDYEKLRFTWQVVPVLIAWFFLALAIAAIGWETFFSLERTAQKNR